MTKISTLEKRTVDDGVVFLAAMATTLRETVTRLEATVGRITDIAVVRSAGTDREMVVTLQEFDRLQQEFVALCEILAKLAAKGSVASGDQSDASQWNKQVIAGVPVAALKDRLERHLLVSEVLHLDPSAAAERTY
jgi:hypothetical protein